MGNKNNGRFYQKNCYTIEIKNHPVALRSSGAAPGTESRPIRVFRRNLLKAYEVADGIDEGDPVHLKKNW
jgi:hypothetical protein